MARLSVRVIGLGLGLGLGFRVRVRVKVSVRVRARARARARVRACSCGRRPGHPSGRLARGGKPLVIPPTSGGEPPAWQALSCLLEPGNALLLTPLLLVRIRVRVRVS